MKPIEGTEDLAQAISNGKIIDFLYKLVDKMSGTEPVIPKKEETLAEYCAKKKQLQFDKSYLRMAYEWAKNSYAKRRQVGCLIVKDRMIISDGFNGSPSGFPNVCEGGDGKTLPWTLHSEANAITKLAKSNNSSEGATLYVTCQPCFDCAKLIIQAGIKRVVYSEDYHSNDGLYLLRKAGVEVERIEL